MNTNSALTKAITKRNTAAPTATEAYKTTIEVDSDKAAKLRAILRLCSRSYTLEDLVDEWFVSLLDYAPNDIFLQGCATKDRCDDWPKEKHQEIRAKIRRICDGDRRLVRLEPFARNLYVPQQVMARLDLMAADKERNRVNASASYIGKSLLSESTERLLATGAWSIGEASNEEGAAA